MNIPKKKKNGRSRKSVVVGIFRKTLIVQKTAIFEENVTFVNSVLVGNSGKSVKNPEKKLMFRKKLEI